MRILPDIPPFTNGTAIQLCAVEAGTVPLRSFLEEMDSGVPAVAPEEKEFGCWGYCGNQGYFSSLWFLATWQHSGGFVFMEIIE